MKHIIDELKTIDRFVVLTKEQGNLFASISTKKTTYPKGWSTQKDTVIDKASLEPAQGTGFYIPVCCIEEKDFSTHFSTLSELVDAMNEGKGDGKNYYAVRVSQVPVNAEIITGDGKHYSTDDAISAQEAAATQDRAFSKQEATPERAAAMRLDFTLERVVM